MPDDRETKTTSAAQHRGEEAEDTGDLHDPSEEDCIFCRIARGELPAEIVFHDQEIIAFTDIQPKAPVHILVVPRQHITSLAALEKGDQVLVGNMLWVAKYLAESHRIVDGGYKVVFNTGVGAGQTVPHLHLHLLGGSRFSEHGLGV